MKYRDFGSTGAKVSALGFGAMRLPTLGEDDDTRVDLDQSVPMLQRGLDLGINFIDTAWAYLNKTSETAVGHAIKGRDRASIYIATKNPIDTDVKEWRKRLDLQLEKLDTDYIDFYHIHSMQWRLFKKKAVPEGYMKELERARDEGLIRHISFSCHDSPHNIMKLIDTGEFSSMLVQYNLLHRYNEAAIAHAKSKGMGVSIMGPIGGGRIDFMSRLKPREGRTIAELALRFVLSNENVSVALSGMHSTDMIDENCAMAENDGPLSQIEGEDIQAMLDQLQGLEDLYCTGCGYCVPCPNGVNIPANFLMLNYELVYSFGGGMSEAYNKGLKAAKASADYCIECGECVEKCPQDIDIPERLKDVAKQFASEEEEPSD
jgi:predicted aldo/keto reductase-like oxidoreductase